MDYHSLRRQKRLKRVVRNKKISQYKTKEKFRCKDSLTNVAEGKPKLIIRSGIIKTHTPVDPAASEGILLNDKSDGLSFVFGHRSFDDIGSEFCIMPVIRN